MPWRLIGGVPCAHRFVLWAFIVSVVVCLEDIHSSFEQNPGKIHLSGIRRIPHRAIHAAPTAVRPAISSESLTESSHQNPPKRVFTSTSNIHMHAPLASSPPESFPVSRDDDQDRQAEQQREESAYAESNRFLSSRRPMEQPLGYSYSRPAFKFRLRADSGFRPRPLANRKLTRLPLQKESFDRWLPQEAPAPTQIPSYRSRSPLSKEMERQRRIQARWRKIGPLVGKQGSRFQRMRLIQQPHWHHPTTLQPTTTTPATTVQTTRDSEPTTRRPLPQQVYYHQSTPSFEVTRKVSPAEMAIKSTQASLVPSDEGVNTNNIRRQSAKFSAPSFDNFVAETPLTGFEKPQKPARAFGSQTNRRGFTRRLNGPVLTPLPESSVPESLPPQLRKVLQPVEEGPRIVEDYAPINLPTAESHKEDYHHRQSVKSEKKFKLVPNRLSYRPRLTIRRPGEKPQARADAQKGRNVPISLPGFSSFDTENRKPLPESAFPQPPPVGTPKQRNGFRPPPTTSWGDLEPDNGGDFETPVGRPGGNLAEESGVGGLVDEGPSGASLGHGGGSSPEDSGAESGSAFGGLGTPPPGFNEAFGLNGASVDLPNGAPVEVEPPPPPPPTTTTTTQRPTTPEAPLIIPENSGLRPVAPPKELTGGFGSSNGRSPFGGGGFGGGGFGGGAGGFGGGAGGFGGGAGGFGGAPPAPKPKPKQPEPEVHEQDIFTGDSALIPNKRGPTGDGYGPPVFPGQAIPPPVSAVSVGGGAAGISPFEEEQHHHIMEATENTPTTVKPSALLSILNKADEGFNQVISHVEAGTPVEAALIDIMEVALGSQKLDSQAKLLSHVDRTFGLDNLQRLQRWMNTGGAFDMVKEQFVKILQNYKPPPERQITIPPQFEYLLQPERSG